MEKTKKRKMEKNTGVMKNRETNFFSTSGKLPLYTI